MKPESLNSLSLEQLTELQELLEQERAETARASLTEYVKQIEIPGTPIVDEDGNDTESFYPERLTPARHHELIIEKLEAVERGELKRLMLLMGPGTAKSTYATVAFPTWYMGRRPNRHIGSLSYGDVLCRQFGAKCLQLAATPDYERIFDTRMPSRRAACLEWGLPSGSTYFGSGILGGITGRRLHGVVIDDPIKGREAADSPTIRNKTWEAYKADVRTRLIPGGFIVLILTRWHEDDPAGRILPQNYNGETGWIDGRDGERWYVLCLQTQCERKDDPLGREIGEFIWPEWFSREHFEAEKKAQGARNWSALYQQRPAPETGDFFHESWFSWYDQAPAHLTKYGASDYAITERDGDWTVHGVCGVDPNDDLYVLDIHRKQSNSLEGVEAAIDMMARYDPMAWVEEKAQIEKALGPFIAKRQRERKVYTFRVQLPTTGDKMARAQAFRARAAQGKVYLPRNAPWVADLLAELLVFPNGTNDDQVDVCGLFGRILNEMTAARTPPKAKETRGLTLDEAIAQDEAVNSRENRRYLGL